MYFIEIHKRKEAQLLFEKAFKIATEYSFTQLVYSNALELMINASVLRRSSQFKFYKRKIIETEIDLMAESKAKQIYHEMVLKFNTKRGVSEEVYQKYITTLTSYSCTSLKFIELFYMLQILQSLSVMNDELTVKGAKTALSLLGNRKGDYKSIFLFFTKNKAIAHLALGEYTQAQQLLKAAEQYASPRSFNRGILHFYQAQTALYSEQYQEAYHLYRQHRKIKNDTLREQWTVLGAYMYFLKKVGKVDMGTDRFSLGKYLNETSATAHDKRGNHLNVLIGEMLVYLVRDRGKFIDRVEAIQAYSYKYLRKKDTQRAKWFIRILCMLPRANFHPVAINRLAQKSIEQLTERTIQSGENFAVELIPYRNLLKMLMLQLNRKVA